MPAYPEDAATQASPFFDVLLMGTAAEDRYSDALVVGGQLGGYIAGRLRLSARVMLPTDPSDNSEYYDSTLVNFSQKFDLPSVIFGGSVGIVVARRTKFVFSPGLMVSRTDVSDYGTLFGASLPFEWVMRGGTRFGLEVNLGRGLGGSNRYERFSSTSTTCAPGDEVTRDRDSGIFFNVAAAVGFGFGYPEPVAPGRTP